MKSTLIAFFLILSFLIPQVNAQTTATTNAELIQKLLAQIVILQAELAKLTGNTTPCTFTRTLREGTQGTDVSCLQTYLKKKGHFSGNATGFYGPQTKDAVYKWQKSVGIVPEPTAIGMFGPRSQETLVREMRTTPSIASTNTNVVPSSTTKVGTSRESNPNVKKKQSYGSDAKVQNKPKENVAIPLKPSKDSGSSIAKVETITLIDFGKEASENAYGLTEWRTTIKDQYTDNQDFGPGGTTIVVGNNAGYNFQGVSGSPRTFKTGDTITVTWFNASTNTVSFTPNISFTDTDRPVSGVTGIWYPMTRVTIPGQGIGLSEYVVTTVSAGTRTLVNIHTNYTGSSGRIILADKITLTTQGSMNEQNTNPGIASAPASSPIIPPTNIVPTPDITQVSPVSVPTTQFREPISKNALNPTEEYTVMDFNDSVLHDLKWANTQPKGTVVSYVSPKGDSGTDVLSLAIGEGRNGSNALLVQSHDAKAGLPGFWVMRESAPGGNVYNEQGYFLPRGKRANRLEMWVRFSPEYRSTFSAKQPPFYPNHENVHIGTYQFDPKKIGKDRVVESDNWHFYYQLWLRHDIAQGDWFHIVLNQMPQHQRSLNASPPNNPTLPSGNFWELLTRLYFDSVPYFASAEIPYPVKLWVDDIKLTYVDEHPKVMVQFEDIGSGGIATATSQTQIKKKVHFINTTLAEVCGVIAINASYIIAPKLYYPNTTNSVPEKVCLPAFADRVYDVAAQPSASLAVGTTYSLGITFIDNDQVFLNKSTSNPSLNDPNVEKRLYEKTGTYDAVVGSDFIRVKVASSTLLSVPTVSPTASSNIKINILASLLVKIRMLQEEVKKLK